MSFYCLFVFYYCFSIFFLLSLHMQVVSFSNRNPCFLPYLYFSHNYSLSYPSSSSPSLPILSLFLLFLHHFSSSSLRGDLVMIPPWPKRLCVKLLIMHTSQVCNCSGCACGSVYVCARVCVWVSKGMNEGPHKPCTVVFLTWFLFNVIPNPFYWCDFFFNMNLL